MSQVEDDFAPATAAATRMIDAMAVGDVDRGREVRPRPHPKGRAVVGMLPAAKVADLLDGGASTTVWPT